MKTRDAFRAQLIAGLLTSSLVLAPCAYAQKPKPAATASSDKTGDKPAAEKPLDKKQQADAKKHYGDAVTKYNAGDFDGALKDFQAADDIKQTPQTARFIGLCLDQLGRFPEALAAYNRFLASVPPKMATQGDEVKGRVAAIQQLPGKLHVTSDPPGAAFTVDGTVQPKATPADVDVAPGHHSLHFTLAGRDPADKDVDVTFASKQDVSGLLPVSAPPPPPPAPVAVVAPPPAAATPPPTPAPAPAPQSHTAAWITGGAAVVAVGIGTAFGIMALNDKSNFDANPTNSTADTGENHALIADMAFGVAITLGVTSLVLFLSRDEAVAVVVAKNGATPAAREASAKKGLPFKITAAPIMTPHGGGAGALIQF